MSNPTDPPRLAISIRQPWAELILSGRKRIEVRSWATDYRGPLWLHVGQKADPDLERRFAMESLFRGGFAGVIQLQAILPLTPDRWAGWRHFHLDPGEFRHGLQAWLLSRPIRFAKPIRWPGNQKLFEPAEAVIEQLRGQLAACAMGEYDGTTRASAGTRETRPGGSSTYCERLTL